MSQQHLRFDVNDQGIAILTLDVAEQRMNTLSPMLWEAFEQAFTRLEKEPSIKAMVFTSGKKDSFIAGADIHVIQKAPDKTAATKMSQELHQMLNRFELLTQKHGKPVVAAIDGPCLGGGLELALACRYRVITQSPKTILGLPEVKLGLLPGGGGTQRLPRLVGVAQALGMILTGKNIRPAQALKMGLVDQVVPKNMLMSAAIQLAQAALQGKADKPKPHGFKKIQAAANQVANPQFLQGLALEANPLGLRLLFKKAQDGLLKQTHGNYPAPKRAIEVVRTGMLKGMQAGFKAEAEAFGDLAMTPESKALIHLYFSSEELKKDNGVANPEITPKKIKHVGMLGGGLMGGGIATVSLTPGQFSVRIKEVNESGVANCRRYVQKYLDKQVAKRRKTSFEVPQLMGALTGSSKWMGFGQTDVMIEAVFEDIKIKHAVLQEAEKAGRDDLIFASNTSCIPITKIATASKHPETVIGMHYFSPVEKMPLLEVITHEKTADWVTATCVGLGKAQGKTVIVVNDGPGFYTTRILVPYMNEAAHLISEGVPIETIDRALVHMGFPVGPITLMDEVGLDTGAKISHLMLDVFGDRMALPPAMDKVVADNRKGRKNNRGFFTYENGKKGGVDPSVYAFFEQPKTKPVLEEKHIQDRIALQMVNEAVHCLEGNILRSPRDGDIGAIFGLGFPPFLGGPFYYIDRMGAQNIVQRLEKLEQQYGARFAPAPLLKQYAQNNQKFYA